MSLKKSDSERVRDIAPLGIRLSAELKQRVSDAAKISGKSMNAFVVGILEEALPDDLTDARDLFLTKAAYHYSQSAMRWPQFYSEDHPLRIAAIMDQEVFARYLNIRHPTVDPQLFLNEAIDEDDFGLLMVSEVAEKQRQIREAVAGFSKRHSTPPDTPKV